jgi:hypothetical protein
MGKYITWKVVESNDITGTMKKEESTCEACNGKGYAEYAMFTPEEANAILKYCGLNTEN